MRAARPRAVLVLKGEKPGAPAFAGDAGAFGGDGIRMLVEQVLHDLPADGRVGIEEPVDHRHAATVRAARPRGQAGVAPRAPPRPGGTRPGRRGSTPTPSPAARCSPL